MDWSQVADIGGIPMCHAPVASNVACHLNQESYHFAGLASELPAEKDRGTWAGDDEKGAKSNLCLLETARMIGDTPRSPQPVGSRCME
jgi:hypothetical protein